MKKYFIVAIILNTLLGCNGQAEKQNGDFRTTKENIMNDSLDIELIRKYYVLQQRMDYEDIEFDNSHDLSNKDIEITLPIIYSALKNRGYDNKHSLTILKEKLGYKKLDTPWEFVNIFDDSCMNWEYDKNFFENREPVESGKYYIVDNKNYFITDIFLIRNIINVKPDNTLQVNVPEYIIHRNKYLFNNDRASLVWLLYNDKDFLKTLLVVFGYDDEEVINKMVLEELYKSYEKEIPVATKKIGEIFFVKDCQGKLKIRKNLLKYVEKTLSKDNDKYISALSDYMLFSLYDNDSRFTDVEKAEIAAYISDIEIRGRMQYRTVGSQGWFGTVNGLYFLQHEKAGGHPEVIEIMKKHNYFGFEFLKNYIESGELEDEVPDTSIPDEEISKVINENKVLPLYSRPDWNSFSQDIRVEEAIKYIHKVSGWDYVKIGDQLGYFPPVGEEKPVKKHSFLVEDEPLPKKEKSFWDKLFG